MTERSAGGPKIFNLHYSIVGPIWRGENTHPGAHNFYPIFIPLFEAKVSGVSVQPSRRPKKRTIKSKKKLWQCRVGHRARRDMVGTVADPTQF